MYFRDGVMQQAIQEIIFILQPIFSHTEYETNEKVAVQDGKNYDNADQNGSFFHLHLPWRDITSLLHKGSQGKPQAVEDPKLIVVFRLLLLLLLSLILILAVLIW